MSTSLGHSHSRRLKSRRSTPSSLHGLAVCLCVHSSRHRLAVSVVRAGAITDSEEDLFRRFTREVQRNLHVVFTMNPAGADFDNRCTTSPALFNRCVVDWFGTWSSVALAQVRRCRQQPCSGSTSGASPIPSHVINLIHTHVHPGPPSSVALARVRRRRRLDCRRRMDLGLGVLVWQYVVRVLVWQSLVLVWQSL